VIHSALLIFGFGRNKVLNSVSVSFRYYCWGNDDIGHRWYRPEPYQPHKTLYRP